MGTDGRGDRVLEEGGRMRMMGMMGPERRMFFFGLSGWIDRGDESGWDGARSIGSVL